MASVTEIRYVDDLDGSDAVGTVAFGLDGKNYEIDLSEANQAKLMGAFAQFIAAARHAGRMPKRPTGGTVTSIRASRTGKVDRVQNQAIREWAQRRGMEVAERGRIPAAVVEEYHKEGGRVTALANPPRNGTSVSVSPEIASEPLTSTKPEPRPEPVAVPKPTPPKKPGRIRAVAARNGTLVDEDKPTRGPRTTRTSSAAKPASLRPVADKKEFKAWCQKHGIAAPRSGKKLDRLYVAWDGQDVDTARALVGV